MTGNRPVLKNRGRGLLIEFNKKHAGVAPQSTLKALALAFGLITPGSLMAATITKIDSSKGGAYIDEGKNSGIEKGASVCFYDSGDAELGCGKVVKVSKSKAIVKLKKKKVLQKLEVGMTARIMEGEGEEKTSASDRSSDKGPLKSKRNAMKHRRNFKAMYILGLVPAAYKKLSYDPDPVATSTKYTWKDNGSTSLNISGAGAELEIPASTVSFSIGAKYRYFFDFISTSDYGQNQPSNIFVELKESGTAVGGWLDFHFLEAAMGKSAFFKVGLGLDFDSSTVTLVAVKKDDDKKIADAEIANAKSAATTLSLRLPFTLSFFFDPVGIHLGVIPLVPVSSGSTFSATFVNGATDETAAEDLKVALGHKKSSFGADFQLGLFASF